MNYSLDTTFEPSIGQIEYIRYLHRENASSPSFILLEEEMVELNVSALEKAVACFVRRHESVRTVFPLIEGQVRQLVLPADERFQIEHIDERDYTGAYSELKNECTTRAVNAFSQIGIGPLIRFFLFRRKSGSYGMATYIHHVLCDEWSSGIINREIGAFYNAYVESLEPEAPPMTIHLRHYCEHQNHYLRTHREKLIKSWEKRLDGFCNLFDTAAFYRRYQRLTGLAVPPERLAAAPDSMAGLHAVLSRFEGARYNSIIDGVLFENLTTATRLNKWTLTSLVYASLYAFISTYSDKPQVLLVALIADRFLPAHQQLIGCLLGATYFPRNVTEDMTIDEFVKAVLKDILFNSRKLILSHEFLELDAVKMQTASDIYINYIRRDEKVRRQLHDTGKHYPTNELSYPIECVIIEYTDGIIFEWRYNNSLFSKAMFEHMIGYHRQVLEWMVANSGDTIGGLKKTLECTIG
ncbi:condensation domain-containing protein [Chitinophaga sp. HK235]|uniref:condensation domain-containing protein n=1 Tax=Chitinophaga sp. HK235 TaxID=2952571 RepID=UPI001BA63597|nr:condensation domain-containing protein [Chitinophaga sp. HK235]